MRLLIISPYPLFPAVAGGKIRIVAIARRLAAAGLEVTVLTPFHFTQRRSAYAAEPFGLVQVPYPFLAPLLFTDRPLPFGFLVSLHPGLGTLLRRRLRSFDAYQFEHCYLGNLARQIPGDRLVTYDAHNVELDYVLSECSRPSLRRLVGRRMRRLESDLIARAAHVFACSEDDRARLAALYGVGRDRTSIAANGVPAPDDAGTDPAPLLRRFPQLAQRRIAIFSGSDVAHNRAAVRFVLASLAPALSAELTFVIHGSCAGSATGDLPGNVVLDATGGPMAGYAALGAVGLNPVTQGGGTNLKLLHYLAHGMAAVSTPFGLRGYDRLAPHVVVADLEGFAAVLRAAVYPPPARHDALQEHFGWDRIAADMALVYRQLAATRGRPA